LSFLRETLNPDDIPLLQQVCGEALFRKYKHRQGVMLFGPGANGKSVILKVLNKLLGVENVSNRSLQELANDRFVTADLIGMFANIYADLDARALNHTGIFKNGYPWGYAESRKEASTCIQL
jgi:putative DNA primase/helicase